MMSRRFARKPLAFLVPTLVFAAGPLPAAHAEESGFELEEIVVTARKRQENLQQTPLAVSAFSGENLEQRGILNIAGLNKAVPGIEVQAGNGVAGVANIYIRGVGQRNTEPNLDSGVGVYLDGVYISRSDGALLDMNDVASVQVLRGPQGTLFGKNTTGGALLIETNRPVQEFEGKASVTVGNYDQLDASLVVNVPLVDETLYTRLSLMSVARDGYIDNRTLGTEYNDADRLSGIWQLRWLPAENLTADLNLNYAETEQRPRGLQCQPSSVNFGEGWLATLQNGFVQPSYGGKSLEDFCLDSASTGKDETLQDLGGGYWADNTGASLTLNWEIAGSLALRSISAWRNTQAGQNDDLDPLSIPFLHRSNDAHPFAAQRDTDQYSQEFDFTGEAMGDLLSYIAGLYYFKEETTDSTTVGITGPFYIQNPAIPPALDAVYYNGTATELLVDNEAWAAFLQGDWSLSENWELTTGLRYTKETRELTRNSFLPVQSTLSTGPFVIPSSGIFLMQKGSFNPLHDFYLSDVDSDDVDDDAWTPLVSLSYQMEDVGFIETGNAYLTWSKGFRSGGLSEAPSADLEEFDPEEVDSIELGFKFDAFERRLRVNAALFYLQYDDRQLTTIVVSPEGRIAGATVNAKESSVTGFELESTVLPVDNLELTFNATWYDGEIGEWEDVQLGLNESTAGGGVFVPSGPGCVASATSVAGVGTVESCIIDRSDENLPRLPDRTFLVAAQYFLGTAVGTFVPRIEYSKKYEIESCFDRLSCVSGDFLSDHEDLSARLSWLSVNERWSVSAYVNNITDEDFVIGGQPLYDSWGFGGYVYAPPRMYGAELTYRW